MSDINVYKQSFQELDTYYWNQLKKLPSFTKGLVLPDLKHLTAGSKILTNTDITGVLVLKPRDFQKKPYYSIETLFGKDIDILLRLLSRADDLKENKAGFTSSMIPSDRVVTAALLKNGYIRTSNWYGTTTSKLLSKLNTGSNVDLLKFDKTNRSEYKREFIKLLTAHDEQNNNLFNRLVNDRIMSVNLKRSHTHQTKLSYFTETVIKDPNWFVFLLTIKEEYGREVIGFIKGKRDANNTIFVDFHVPKNLYRGLVSEVLYKFLKQISKSKIGRISIITNPIDKPSVSTYNRLFGDMIGNEYFKF